MSVVTHTAAQKVFKRLVVHNKIMDEATVEKLLAREPDPEKILRFLVQQEKLKKDVGQQLLMLYRKQLEKQAAASETAAAPIGAGAATADSAPQASALAPDDLPLLELDTDDDPATAATPAAAESAAVAPARGSATPKSAEGAAAKRAWSPTIVKILTAARALGASDVHIKSGEIPLVRVAGALRELENHPSLALREVEAGLLSLLNDGQRERFLSTNDLDMCFDGGAELGRFRTNYMRQHRGVDGIFRLISAEVPSFEQLHLPPMVRKFTEYKQGIVLVTGPKGCGKTTTLAAMVDLINSTRAEHIITIEDPIEFVHPCKKGHVNQREVGPHTESFSNALRAALREAPDVIMVGEMRDLETTSLAITAAETGHLVFATLHTPDAIRTIDRVLDVFPPKEQGQIRSMVSESMRGIISQLLLPSIDGKRQELAVEILVNTTAIGNLIREEKTFQLRGIMQTGRRLGMQLMDDSLLALAKAGRIAKEEAVAVAAEQVRVRKELGI